MSLIPWLDGGELEFEKPPSKPMKFRLPLAIVALLLGAVSIPLQAATVFIANHSFEDATNTSWLRASDGTTSIVRTFGVIASAVHDTPPDGSDTINHSNG